MTKTILVTRPSHDTTTTYLSYWAEDIIQIARTKSFKVLDLPSSKATRNLFTSYILKQNPQFLFMNGHGSPTQVTGHNNESLLDLSNTSVIKNKILYAVSCDAAKVLGSKVVTEGAQAFIGYEESFGFVHSTDRDCTPPKDKIVDPFKTASNAVPQTLLKGHSVNESYLKSQKQFRDEIRKHALSDARPENKEIRFWLFWGMQCQKLYGNPHAQF